MDLRQLERFVVVAETQTVGAAALRLGLSQPALTRSLHLLEEALGQALFDRLPRGVRLTAFGRALLPQAKLVLNDCRRLSAVVDAFNGAARGVVAFGVSPNLAEGLGADALLQFTRRHPQVSAAVHTSAFAELVAGLQDGGLDLALSTVGAEAPPPELTFEPLVEQMMSILVGARHPLAEAGHATFEVLSGQTWMVAHGASAVEGLRRTFEVRGARPPFCNIRCDSLALQRRLLLSGDYVAIMDQEVVRDDIAAGRVKVLRTENEGIVLRSGLLYRAEAPLSLAASALAHLLRQAARQRERDTALQ